jgi:hypothetical protein
MTFCLFFSNENIIKKNLKENNKGVDKEVTPLILNVFSGLILLLQIRDKVFEQINLTFQKRNIRTPF